MWVKILNNILVVKIRKVTLLSKISKNANSTNKEISTYST